MISASKREGVLNLSYLRDMSGDSPEFMIEMLDTLIEQIPSYLDDLRKAIIQGDWAATAAFAHKVKPTFYYVGREDLRDYLQKIETNAKDLLDLAQLPIAMQEIDEEMGNLILQVEQARAELQARI